MLFVEFQVLGFKSSKNLNNQQGNKNNLFSQVSIMFH